jgi:hypothetical protein
MGKEQNSVGQTTPAPDSMLEGPFWPERIKVISCKRIGTNLEISGIGSRSEHFYSRILTREDLRKVRIVEVQKKVKKNQKK